MRPEEFTENKSGKLIKAPQGYLAFSPNPLPPPLSLSWDLVNRTAPSGGAPEKGVGPLVRPFTSTGG